MGHRVSESTRDEQPLVTRVLKWWTWQRVLVAIAVILIVLEIGTYAFSWNWTGFKAEGTLWDWLGLLLVPITVAAIPIWYSIHQSRSDSASLKHEIG
jgi:hypothetical protein